MSYRVSCCTVVSHQGGGFAANQQWLRGVWAQESSAACCPSDTAIQPLVLALQGEKGEKLGVGLIISL